MKIDISPLHMAINVERLLSQAKNCMGDLLRFNPNKGLVRFHELLYLYAPMDPKVDLACYRAIARHTDPHYFRQGGFNHFWVSDGIYYDFTGPVDPVDAAQRIKNDFEKHLHRNDPPPTPTVDLELSGIWKFNENLFNILDEEIEVLLVQIIDEEISLCQQRYLSENTSSSTPHKTIARL